VTLRHQGRAIEVTLTTHGTRTRLSADGRTFEARVTRDGPSITVERGGGASRVAVAAGAHGLWVAFAGRTFRFDLPGGEAEAGPPENEESEVRAPMTARVVAVTARPGAGVAEGALLATLEAMKMEFRLTAPFEGTVEEVHCRDGDRVDVGQLLVRLKPSAAAETGARA
jgi:biotin carboxyl carrier protein